ncbi:MAG: hypothetical protein AMS26_20080 [Bacteroides sp. SM23_62]|nr:MAG: hypothetical protein AMS26_20080 [Bacteroides sp. SM23_62]
MSENVFLSKDVNPTEELIKANLADNYAQLEEIRKFIDDTFGETLEEWKNYGEKIGWLLKKLYKKRNLFFITVCDGYFNVTFVFGDKAVDSIVDSEISPSLKTALMEARKYAEGRGLSIKVEDDIYLPDIKKLLQIKVNN